MSQIQDFGCMVTGCTDGAAEMVGTDPEWGDGELVALCASHYGLEYHGVALKGLEVGGRILICDTAGSWFYIPEKPVIGGRQ